MKNILFIAPPAGGKGTCSEYLSGNYGYIHISTGDLLRDIDKTSDLGKEVANLISKGKLVNDEIVLSLLKDKLISLSKSEHFILDGFPRNIAQAKELDTLLKELNMSLDKVILLDIPYDIGEKRALGRVSCPKCKRVYNTFLKPPKVEGICDECSSELVHRSDDDAETYRVRFNQYESLTIPLLEFYDKQNKLIKIDGVNDTLKALVSVINDD